ncbi:MAG TPA: hypothetical protein VHI78_05935 [Bacteroidales bacterium]|jgi:hypothetical protein|nr:hypothetical protein [Bacteroidales bacterium]
MKQSINKVYKTGKPTKLRYQGKKQIDKSETDLEGYPDYPPEEDIYVQFKEEPELNPEEPTKPKDFSTLDDAGDADTQEVSGKDLDIPGGELDDEMEGIGSEDEENNYYSLGEDNDEYSEENSNQ